MCLYTRHAQHIVAGERKRNHVSAMNDLYLPKWQRNTQWLTSDQIHPWVIEVSSYRWGKYSALVPVLYSVCTTCTFLILIFILVCRSFSSSQLVIFQSLSCLLCLKLMPDTEQIGRPLSIPLVGLQVGFPPDCLVERSIRNLILIDIQCAFKAKWSVSNQASTF